MGMKMLAVYSWLRVRPAVGCCEQNNEHLGCIKVWELLHQQTYYQLPNKASSPLT